MTNDDPSFAEGETPAESTAAGTAGPGQLERLSAQALAYRPEARTYLREAEWAEWAEYLVPYALGAAMDSSDPRRLRLLLSMVAGLLDYCLAEGIANTAHPERVLRESSIDRYLVKLKGDGTLGTTLTQTKWALSKVAAATPQTPLMLGPGVAGDGLAPQATSSASTQSGKASGKYALLTTQGDGEPNPADLWAAYEPQYWAVLAAIRDQVLAQHPNAHAVVSRPTGVALPLGDVEVARLLAAAELAGGRRRESPWV